MTDEDLARIRTVALALFASLESETRSPREAVAALLIATGMCASIGVDGEAYAWDDVGFQAAGRALFRQGWDAVQNVKTKEAPPPGAKP